jgi:PUA domain protein
MQELSFRKRHRLKSKEVRALGTRMEEAWGVNMLDPSYAVDRAKGLDMDFLIIDGLVAYLVLEDVPFPTLRTLLEHGLDTNWVEVDEGAVRFLANGADCMAPGVVAADTGIKEGDMVYVRDNRHKRPLTVGTAVMPGPQMVVSGQGKAVRTLHYVGDRIWEFE